MNGKIHQNIKAFDDHPIHIHTKVYNSSFCIFLKGVSDQSDDKMMFFVPEFELSVVLDHINKGVCRHAKKTDLEIIKPIHAQLN